MAQLLGSRFCIESLHNDVSDLQTVVVDVFSRTGPVTQPSWKYPDKAANNVNVDELLEIYVFTDDEEERQVAHIVLLELVIDRLVVLLQAMAKYVDNMLVTGRVASAIPASNNTSIGLVVKKYWNRMVQVNTTTKQLQSEAKSKSRKIHELEDAVEKLSEAVDNLRSGTGESVLNLSANSGRKSVNPDAFLPGGMDSVSFANLLSANSAKKKVISKDECNKASQTIETTFVPCEACDRVQTHLRQVGKEFVSLCYNQELPSLLDRHMNYVKDVEWMTHHDIARWVGEQKKDLVKLNKHLKDLKSTIEPLQENLAKEQDRTKKLQEKVSSLGKQLALEKETQSIQLSHIEGKVEDARAVKQKEINVIQKQKDQLAFAKRELETQFQTTATRLQKAEVKLKEYETSQRDLQLELERSQTDNSTIRQLKSDLKEAGIQLDKTRGKLSEASRELNKERARGKSVHKHTELLQGKQDSLIQRIDSLAEENEELRNQVTDLHEDKERQEDNLKKGRNKQHALQEKIHNYESKVEKLSRSNAEVEAAQEKLSRVERELEEAQERERLIIEYPDLNGPVNKDLVGTGNVAVDMENQVKANSVRIRVLEDQNAGLRNTISRMLQLQTDATGDSDGVPLWNQNTSHVTKVEVKEYGHAHMHEYHSDGEEDPVSYMSSQTAGHNDRPVSPYQQSQPIENNDNMLFYKRNPSDRPTAKARPTEKGALDWLPPDTFTVKPSPKPKSAKTTRTRPTSAKPALGSAGHAGNSSAINAYLSLRQAGKIKSAGPSGRSKSAKPVPDGYKAGDPITCDKCDKTYMHIKDLQIHKNYCFGGI